MTNSEYYKAASKRDIKLSDDHIKEIMKRNRRIIGQIGFNRFKKALLSPQTPNEIRAQLVYTLFTKQPIPLQKFLDLGFHKKIDERLVSLWVVGDVGQERFEYLYFDPTKSREGIPYKLSKFQKESIKTWKPNDGAQYDDLLNALLSGKPASAKAENLIRNVILLINSLADGVVQHNKNNDPQKLYHETTDQEAKESERQVKEVSPSQRQRIAAKYLDFLHHMMKQWDKYTGQLTNLGIDTSAFSAALNKVAIATENFVKNEALSSRLTDIDIDEEFMIFTSDVLISGEEAVKTGWTTVGEVMKIDITEKGINKKGGLEIVEDFEDYKPERLEKRKQAINQGIWQNFVKRKIEILEDKNPDVIDQIRKAKGFKTWMDKE